MNGKARVLAEIALLFAVVLAGAGILFYAQNRNYHDRSSAVEYDACVKDRQIAANQQRVLESLISMNESLAGTSPIVQTRATARATLPGLYQALALVPEFECK